MLRHNNNKTMPQLHSSQCSLTFMTSFKFHYNFSDPILQKKSWRFSLQQITFPIALYLHGRAIYCTSGQPPASFARKAKLSLCSIKEQIQLLPHRTCLFASLYGVFHQPLGRESHLTEDILFSTPEGIKVFFLPLCYTVLMLSELFVSTWSWVQNHTRHLLPSTATRAPGRVWRTKVDSLPTYISSKLLSPLHIILFHLQHKSARDVQWFKFMDKETETQKN